MKRQVVDGEGVNMLYNRLRNKYSLLLTVTNTDLDITMYERESQATISRKLINEPTYAYCLFMFCSAFISSKYPRINWH